MDEYESKKSIFEHNDSQKLLDKFAGKGKRSKGNFGEAGYQELVNFEEHIGFNMSTTGVLTPTTWGKIHYSKNGAHIVPTAPQ